ncbi:uncharacterized protein VTP21DRAFT_6693 [Calcarisporiella thermophila]|uniref:uncharacterized protein n=1 Tax=Calcarisporiella thermophila TaxID=911321 RepID=UPI0037431365
MEIYSTHSHHSKLLELDGRRLPGLTSAHHALLKSRLFGRAREIGRPTTRSPKEWRGVLGCHATLSTFPRSTGKPFGSLFCDRTPPL